LEIIVQRFLERTKENHNKPHKSTCLGGHVRLSPRGMKSEAPLALWSHKTFKSLHFAKTFTTILNILKPLARYIPYWIFHATHSAFSAILVM